MIAQVANGSAVPSKMVATSAAPAKAMSAFADLMQEFAPPAIPVKVQSVALKTQPVPVPASSPEPVVVEATQDTPAVVTAAPGPVKTAVAETASVALPLLKPAEATATPVPSGTARPQKKVEAAKSESLPAPFVAVVAPEVVPVKPVARPQAEVSEAPAAPVAATSDEPPPPPSVLAAPAAVEIKIRPEEPQPVAPPVQAVPVMVPKAVMPVEAAVVPQAAVTETVPVAAVVAPVHAPLQTPAPRLPPATVSQSPLTEEPVADAPKTQPIRSVSIEFAADGAQDVKLRLSERAGDVHISLHTPDASLSGRLNDGVKDLVESLTTAGYDAQAWTPDQGRQNQRQDEEPRKTRRNGSEDPDAEKFGGIMQQGNIQAVQETS